MKYENFPSAKEIAESKSFKTWKQIAKDPAYFLMTEKERKLLLKRCKKAKKIWRKKHAKN